MLKSLAPFKTDELKAAKVMAYFLQILNIPRPSGEEEQIREYLIEYALDHHFSYRIDEIGNLAIDIPAHPEFHDAPRVIFQCHMDMVCVGGNDIKAISPIVEHGWLRADGTSLGADNGIGMALALAIGAEVDLKKGPMTLLITVAEEEGMSGAQNLGLSLVPKNTEMIINLDSEDGINYICRGSAHGNLMEGLSQFKRVHVEKKLFSVKIIFKGLLGGHSGVDIHKGHGNGIILLTRLLLEILEKLKNEFYLISFEGGARSNAIPSSAEALIAFPKKYLEGVGSIINRYNTNLVKEMGEEGKQFSIETENITEEKNIAAIDQTFVNQLLSFVVKVPDGPLKFIEGYDDKVILSSTLGVLMTREDNTVYITLLPRAAKKQDLSRLVSKIKRLFRPIRTAKIKTNMFKGWEEPNSSKAVKAVSYAYKKLFKDDPILYSCHAGLETAEIQARLQRLGYPKIPIVSIGPQIVNAHSLREAVNLASVEEVYLFLQLVLEEIGERF